MLFLFFAFLVHIQSVFGIPILFFLKQFIAPEICGKVRNYLFPGFSVEKKIYIPFRYYFLVIPGGKVMRMKKSMLYLLFQKALQIFLQKRALFQVLRPAVKQKIRFTEQGS